ncbi:MAG: hydrogenase expression/formation protein HypE, partial [Tepidimonas sp.]|nr:hydrogenase expression/formation protein HypE [Tepidimonas sp.]
PALDNPWLRAGDDAAALPLPPPEAAELVMATDGHVVAPAEFPGGDLGRLAVYGTVNDVAMMGAEPLYLSAAFILEEGTPLALLQRLVRSMGEAARQVGVPVVCGDTTVVERGKGDGVFIATTGVGWRAAGVRVGGAQARSGDAVLLSGPLGDHGAALLAHRAGLELQPPLHSDSAPLHTLVRALRQAVPPAALHVLRDPTRGGLAGALHEIAQASGVGFELQEAAIPVRPPVQAVCELLGFDPLHLPCEGRLLAVVAPSAAEAALAALRAHPQGEAAACIGRVTDDALRLVQLRTRLGGRRVVDWLSGEPLPRIC